MQPKWNSLSKSHLGELPFLGEGKLPYEKYNRRRKSFPTFPHSPIDEFYYTIPVEDYFLSFVTFLSRVVIVAQIQL